MAKQVHVESRQAMILASCFVRRRDLYAQQLDDGRYLCIRKPLTLKHLLAHLAGKMTLGTYMLDMESQTHFMVLDADDEDGFERLKNLAQRLTNENMPTYLEKSRRGGHLWFFFAKSLSGSEARQFGLGLLTKHQLEAVELYPKQARLADGPGSLIRMPFGVHRRSGKRYGFFSLDGSPLRPTLREQIEVFSDPETVPEAIFLDYRSYAAGKQKKPCAQEHSKEADVVGRIKNNIRVLDFVSRYVELKAVGRGAVGLCPFHEDEHESFSVNDRDNYWNCFAGCGGGSVIDFWMKWRSCDFSAAVKELAQMLA